MKIFIVAGEASGDLHGSNLIKSIKALHNDCIFEGLGGEKMIKQGLISIENLETLSVTGFWEVAKKYSFFKKLLNKCIEKIKNGKYDAIITIDYPGFNLRLLKGIVSVNIPKFYYIAPQLWAWGESRAKNMKGLFTKLYVVLPFEQEFFNKYDIETQYFGHPLLDNEGFSAEIIPYNNRENDFMIMPGSRKQELKHHLPLICNTVELMKLSTNKSLINYNIVMPNSSNSSIYKNYNVDNYGISLITRHINKLRNAKLGLIKAGTSTLEAALLGLPFISFYRTSKVSYVISKNLININNIALPNILLKRNVFPEIIQNEATAENLKNKILELINNRELIEDQLVAINELKTILGGSGASMKIAIDIMKESGNEV